MLIIWQCLKVQRFMTWLTQESSTHMQLLDGSSFEEKLSLVKNIPTRAQVEVQSWEPFKNISAL
ncbi:hypothetical protein CFP56_014170, partial [Quercus suber]